MSVQRRVRQALIKRAPRDEDGHVEGITRWLDELAAALGYGERTVKDWYYPDGACPTPDALECLFSHFGDDFHLEVYPLDDIENAIQRLRENGGGG